MLVAILCIVELTNFKLPDCPNKSYSEVLLYYIAMHLLIFNVEVVEVQDQLLTVVNRYSDLSRSFHMYKY